MKVNDVDVSDFNCKKVTELLNAVPAGGSVVLLVQGPEGYTTYLHTGKPCFITVTIVNIRFKIAQKTSTTHWNVHGSLFFQNSSILEFKQKNSGDIFAKMCPCGHEQ